MHVLSVMKRKSRKMIMSNEKFTKGDWVLRDNCIGVIDDSDTQSYGMINAICYVDRLDLPEWKDNANLLSQSKNMYRLLEECSYVLGGTYDVNEYPANGNTDCDKMISEIERLLAKARGE